MTPFLHVETSHDLPLVSMMVGFRAGATLDPPGQEGLTRISARMLRRGAGGMNVVELADAIDGIGAEFGEFVGLNAIHFQMDTIRRSFDCAVELMCTLLGDAAYDPHELARLVRETENEVLETRNFDRALCGRAFRRTLFRNHPFSRRISGLPESLARIGRDDAISHTKRVMNRNNVVFAFAGDIEEEEARRAAERVLAVLPEGPAPERSSTDPTASESRTLVFVDKPDRSQTQMLIGCPGTHPRDPDHTAFVLGNTVFGGTFSSRLMTEVRVKRGWSYGACSNAPIDLCREAFSVWTHPDAKDARLCLELELELLEQWHDKGITGKELAFTKRNLSRPHAFEVDTASKRAQRRMLTMIYDLPEDYYDGFLDRLRGVTVRDVNQAIRRRVDMRSLVVAVTGTHERIGEAVEAAIPDLGSVERVPYDLE
ncbi:MAG: M16 family metallopeptidase [Myxococcota bacterium]